MKAVETSGVIRMLWIAASGWIGAVLLAAASADAVPSPAPGQASRPSAHPQVSMFAPSRECLACHNNLVNVRPARRAWIHVTVRDRQGRAVFESGRVTETGLIEGNASDAAAGTFEPHYEQITAADQVQIYESVMGTPAGVPTTGLLQATQYLKDNRLPPRGFDKQTAAPEIAVSGGAATDPDFTGHGDRVRYRVAAAGAAAVEVELRYQPIGYRWAQNLAAYEAAEPKKFVEYYNAVAPASSVVVARASSAVRP
jgi:hypothetical protein